MKRYGSIYLITNLITKKQYVGQTKNNILNRFNDHCRDNRSSRYLSSSIKKYKRENFKIEELMVCFDKKHTFKYVDQANQSGSLEDNTFEHAQRIGFEPAKAE